MPESGTARLRAFLLANVGTPVTGRQLQDACGLLTYSRRIRELRAAGWPIQSRRDNIALAPDEYLLTGQPPAVPPPQFTKRVPKRLRAAVLMRNGSVCRICGLTPEDKSETGRRVTMHVDHIEQQREGGVNTMDNLRTLCSDCNEGSRDVPPQIPLSLARLKSEVRGANESDQREVYQWLKSKFDQPSH